MAVTDEAIERIKRMILSGELAPGDRLPPEKELADKLGLSRSSMREAVKALEVMRVLDVRRGDGTFVTSLEPHVLLEAISFVLDLHGDGAIVELFAVRRVLEAHATALAAQHASADDVAALKGELASLGADPTVEQLVDADLRFHRRIAELSGNLYLAALIESLSAQTARARIWRGLTEAGAVERTLAEHSAIVDALRARDVQRASALASAHVAGVEEWLHRAAS